MKIGYWNSFGDKLYFKDETTNNIPNKGDIIHFEGYECYFKVDHTVRYFNYNELYEVEVTVVPDDEMNDDVFGKRIAEHDLMNVNGDDLECENCPNRDTCPEYADGGIVKEMDWMHFDDEDDEQCDCQDCNPVSMESFDEFITKFAQILSNAANNG